MVGVFFEPTRQEIRLPQAAPIEPIAGTELRKIMQVQRIDVGEPLCVLKGFAGIAQVDAHRSIPLRDEFSRARNPQTSQWSSRRSSSWSSISTPQRRSG